MTTKKKNDTKLQLVTFPMTGCKRISVQTDTCQRLTKQMLSLKTRAFETPVLLSYRYKKNLQTITIRLQHCSCKAKKPSHSLFLF